MKFTTYYFNNIINKSVYDIDKKTVYFFYNDGTEIIRKLDYDHSQSMQFGLMITSDGQKAILQEWNKGIKCYDIKNDKILWENSEKQIKKIVDANDYLICEKNLRGDKKYLILKDKWYSINDVINMDDYMVEGRKWVSLHRVDILKISVNDGAVLNSIKIWTHGGFFDNSNNYFIIQKSLKENLPEYSIVNKNNNEIIQSFFIKPLSISNWVIAIRDMYIYDNKLTALVSDFDNNTFFEYPLAIDVKKEILKDIKYTEERRKLLLNYILPLKMKHN
jgi:hypothetical protein